MAKGRFTGGRKPGAKNRITTDVLGTIQKAFRGSGGQRELTKWAIENRDEFYTKVYVRTLPKDINVDVGESLESLIMKSFEKPKGPSKEKKVDK